MRTALVVSHLAALGGVQDVTVKDYRASEWLPIYTAADAPKKPADARKGVEQTRLALRALVGARLAKHARGKGA